MTSSISNTNPTTTNNTNNTTTNNSTLNDKDDMSNLEDVEFSNLDDLQDPENSNLLSTSLNLDNLSSSNVNETNNNQQPNSNDPSNLNNLLATSQQEFNQQPNDPSNQSSLNNQLSNTNDELTTTTNSINLTIDQIVENPTVCLNADTDGPINTDNSGILSNNNANNSDNHQNDLNELENVLEGVVDSNGLIDGNFQNPSMSVYICCILLLLVSKRLGLITELFFSLPILLNVTIHSLAPQKKKRCESQRSLCPNGLSTA